jgi:integrase
MELLDRMKSLDPVNREYLKGYLRELTIRTIRPRTVDTKIWRVYTSLLGIGFKDSRVLTRKDIEEYIIKRKAEVSPVTLDGELLEVKLFLRWLVPEKEKEIFAFKMQRHKVTLPVDRLLTRDDIRNLIEACTNQRDRALVMFLWDSAARISEVMALRVGDIQFDQYGAVVIVDGKTGRRRLRLTAAVPDLQAWVNVHPMKNNREAPLFVTQRRYGSALRQLSKCTVQNTLKAIARRAGVGNVHPHAIRHARLTDMARNGFSEMELRIIAGWQGNSAMPEVYVHLSGADVEKKVLEKAGIIQEKTQPGKDELDAVQCPRCDALNAHDSMYCSKCSMALTDEAARQVQIIERVALSEKTLREIVRDEMERGKNISSDMKKE